MPPLTEAMAREQYDHAMYLFKYAPISTREQAAAGRRAERLYAFIQSCRVRAVA